jgi:hypothetical protein
MIDMSQYMSKKKNLLFDIIHRAIYLIFIFLFQDQMSSPPSVPIPPKSRGLSLFDRQAQLHAHDPNTPFNHPHSTIFDTSVPLPPLKSAHSLSSPPIPSSSVTHHHQISPLLMHRRSPLSSTESCPQSANNNVQLLSVQQRPESTYIKEVPPSLPAVLSPLSEKLLETDFPLIENSAAEESENAMPSDLTCTTVVEQAFDYLTTHDDDDDVVHQQNNDEQQYHNGSFDEEDDDSVNTIDLDATAGFNNRQNDSKLYVFIVYYHPSNSMF